MDLSFPNTEKLKSKKLIETLFAEGSSVSSFPIRLIYLQTTVSEKTAIQAGVTVSKRNFKSAVKRNRIKRLLRESYRHNKPLAFNNSDTNFAFLFLYLGKEMPTYELINTHMIATIEKFKKKKADA